MSDTVSGAVIVSTPGNEGPAFLSLGDAGSIPGLSVLHVPGAAYAEPAALGLTVDFSTFSPDLQVVTPFCDPTELPSRVSGYAGMMPEERPPNVSGAMYHD